ncbi:hypothetical protein RND81_01G089400 [Saponaria officinalis]|uniref:pectinesterase n=1 Tax=Saponaria officinalis TaxID=3572 RepID=A0AAW1NFJ6_SAPOF
MFRSIQIGSNSNMHRVYQIVLLLLLYQTVCLTVSKAIECKSSSSPSNVAHTISVSKNGNGHFTHIEDALKSIPTTNDQWVKILISPGEYREQIRIFSKSCIILEGQDRTTTTITHDVHNTTSGSITFDTYEVDNFIVKGITFRNSYNRPYNKRTPHVPAVALRASGDKHVYHSCGFEGYQDTLWDDKGRHNFKSCYIEGAVDFIWGDAQSVYEHCTINVTGGGHITAQGRDSSQKTSGYVFKNCKILGEGRATLGRAYRAYARVIFVDSYFSNAVNPLGWFIWNQAGHEKDITFAEINCNGPGANRSKRVPWVKSLSRYEVEQFTTNAYIGQGGWIRKFLI